MAAGFICRKELIGCPKNAHLNCVQSNVGERLKEFPQEGSANVRKGLNQLQAFNRGEL